MPPLIKRKKKSERKRGKKEKKTEEKEKKPIFLAMFLIVFPSTNTIVINSEQGISQSEKCSEYFVDKDFLRRLFKGFFI